MARPATWSRSETSRSWPKELAGWSVIRFAPESSGMRPIDPPDDLEIELVESVDDVDLRLVGKARPGGDAIELAFAGELWYWRGPAPYHFISLPPDAAHTINAIAAEVTYGWGMIPVEVRIGESAWTTALWPKDGGYVVPIKDAFRKAERLVLGDTVAVEVVVRR